MSTMMVVSEMTAIINVIDMNIVARDEYLIERLRACTSFNIHRQRYKAKNVRPHSIHAPLIILLTAPKPPPLDDQLTAPRRWHSAAKIPAV